MSLEVERAVPVYIAQQNENRKLWKEGDTPEALIQMLYAELDELKAAIQEAYITGDVFSVASELGDVEYLVQRLGNEIGIDATTAALMKVNRNSAKYPDHIMSNGRDLEDATRVVKESWKAMGGDYSWSHVYLDYLAEDNDERAKHQESRENGQTGESRLALRSSILGEPMESSTNGSGEEPREYEVYTAGAGAIS